MDKKVNFWSKVAILPIVFLSIYSCTSNNTKSKYSDSEIKTETKKVNDFFEKSFERDLTRNPQYQSILGIKDQNNQWNNLSDTFAQESNSLMLQDMQYLRDSINFNALDAQAQLSYKLFMQEDSDIVEGFQYRFHSYPINTQEGLHTDIPTFLINVHSIDNEKDAWDYVFRLSKVNYLFDQMLWQLQKREEMHIILPRFAFPKILAASNNVLKGQPFDNSNIKSPIWEDFTSKVAKLNISVAIKDSLLNSAKVALNTSVKPAYVKLNNYLETLSTKATDTVGAWSWPNGDKFYDYEIRHYTSSHMTPEEVYQLGIKEVDRIHKEIKIIMDTIGYKGTVQDFFKYVKNSPAYFYPNTEAGRQAYLKQNTDVINEMKQHLDEMFLTEPKADIEVKAVEKFREKSAGTAFYDQPAPDGSRPGYFYVNLMDMSQAPIYQIDALAYHEGIPGHHMQIAIAQELNDIPKFRKYGDLTAYVEGWGLYSEKLPKEYGFYKDPVQDFGRLSMELLRAARLVVDPAIHYKHWTREQAIEYFLVNTAEPSGECVNAIERYITWPGQATAYKVGMNKILELRERAKKELGSKFDIRKFHDVVLTNGAVTLSLLEENVNNWIKENK